MHDTMEKYGRIRHNDGDGSVRHTFEKKKTSHVKICLLILIHVWQNWKREERKREWNHYECDQAKHVEGGSLPLYRVGECPIG